MTVSNSVYEKANLVHIWRSNSLQVPASSLTPPPPGIHRNMDIVVEERVILLAHSENGVAMGGGYCTAVGDIAGGVKD